MNPDDVATRAATHGDAYDRRGDADVSSFGAGDLLDEYLVTGVLGEGGMGIVLAARDPDLDRAVAIKILRRKVFDGEGRASAQARLVREAQAMAKLSHPNVITVYRVGEARGLVFVAMEYVDGGTLRGWLRTPRSRGEILEAFGAAGRGLAAAHAAGLVHRDFKPDNVLVGKDGRVRVTDFGLVTTSGGLALPAGARGVHASALTRTGALLGTPAYMAPEQFLGKPTDARTDQFAFCVSLFEALTSERPFAGTTESEVAEAVLAGRVRTPVRQTIPRRLEHVLLRGMATDPAQRFASMTELLEQLRRPHRTRWWIAAVAAGAAVAIGSAAYALTRTGDEPATAPSRPACGAVDGLAGVWDQARHQQLRAAFERTGRADARATFERTARLLDAWAARWTATELASCRATHELWTQPAATFERRAACLARRRADLDQLAGAMIDYGDRASLNVAVHAAAALAPVEDCDHIARLELVVPPPADPTTIDALAVRLAKVRAADRLEQFDRGFKLASAMTPEVEQARHPPLLAEHLYVLGVLQERTQDLAGAAATLQRAAEVAATARDVALSADIALEIVLVEVVQRGKHERADALVAIAEAAVAAVDGDASARALQLELTLALVDHARNRRDAARAHGVRAVDAWTRAFARDPVRFHLGGTAHANLGALHVDDEAFDKARTHFEKAREIWIAALGADNPHVAKVEVDLGVLESRRNDYAASRAHHERAAALYERAADVRGRAMAMSNLADAQWHLRDRTGAIATLRKVVELCEEAYGEKHPEVATALCALGLAELRAGVDAADDVARCLKIREARLPAGHRDIAEAHAYLGVVRENARNLDAALVEYRKAADMFAAAKAPREAAKAEHQTAALYDRRGDVKNALAYFERADASWQTADPKASGAAQSRYSLAQVLWDAGGDRVRARTLAESARAIWAERGDAAQASKVARWLAAHR